MDTRKSWGRLRSQITVRGNNKPKTRLLVTKKHRIVNYCQFGSSLLRVWRAAIGSRDPRTPFQEFFTSIILVNNNLNEAQAILLWSCCSLYCFNQIFLTEYLKGQIQQTVSDASFYYCNIYVSKHMKLVYRLTLAVQHLPSPLWMASTKPV